MPRITAKFIPEILHSKLDLWTRDPFAHLRRESLLRIFAELIWIFSSQNFRKATRRVSDATRQWWRGSIPPTPVKPSQLWRDASRKQDFSKRKIISCVVPYRIWRKWRAWRLLLPVRNWTASQTMQALPHVHVSAGDPHIMDKEMYITSCWIRSPCLYPYLREGKENYSRSFSLQKQ